MKKQQLSLLLGREVDIFRSLPSLKNSSFTPLPLARIRVYVLGEGRAKYGHWAQALVFNVFVLTIIHGISEAQNV